MVASNDTVKLMLEIIRRHVTENQLRAIIVELMLVPGNSSFRETIKKMRDFLSGVERT